jgi:L-asparaginase
MNYKIVKLRTQSASETKASILIIYTGGTLGMSYDANGALVPFNFGKVIERIPSLEFLNLQLTVISFPEPIDSSNIQPSHWVDLAYIIQHNYDSYDGFVIIHGTDTMSYSASMLSYLLQGLSKPVVFTGAQLPIEVARTDARENLATALEIAAAKDKDGNALVPEVSIFFNHMLLRGNRSKKVQSILFDAFESRNYPPLAEAGITIEYNHSYIRKAVKDEKLKHFSKIDSRVAILKLFPGITQPVLEAILFAEDIKGVVLETFGSGNTPTYPLFLATLKKAVDNGKILLNVSQCNGGHVLQGHYQTSSSLSKIGVISGRDITSEAALSKMMFLFGEFSDVEKVKIELSKPIAGEMLEKD